jgi:glutamine phosphoribosylpyrophosphate amidotransferase
MCTVVGYIGKSLCRTYIFEGLARLEYRGYDSAGFACLEPINQKLLYTKASGQLSQLVERLQQNPIDGYLALVTRAGQRTVIFLSVTLILILIAKKIFLLFTTELSKIMTN